MINIKENLKITRLKTTHVIMGSFLVLIILGSILLSLPFSSATGTQVPFIDALFTATTSTCVTGLVTVTTSSTYSTFGHIIILLLIQIGGFGVLTAIFGITFLFNKKLGVSNGLLLQDALNINSTDEIIQFVKKMIAWTFIVEGIGTLCYLPVFIPEYGLKGTWYALFTAVSAFCNAGIDIFKENSLCDYVSNPIVVFTTCSLVVLSSVGYVVWFDVVKNITNYKNKLPKFRNLSLHSKIVLTSTTVLICLGTVLILLFEYNNSLTMGNMNLWQKLQASLFQSVTCRTAGFATVPQENFTNASALTSMVLMFIGGSPIGTAGGVKTVTMVVLISAALSTLRNQEDTELFNRRITKQSINKAVAVVFISLLIILFSTLLLSTCCEASFLDLIYETVSACATVGVTRGVTPNLSTMGKLIIIVTMFLGRVGPISLIVAFNKNKEHNQVVKCPSEEIYIG